MKEQLKRDLNKTYLILSDEEKRYDESYEIEMILKNEPKALLPLHVLRMDGGIQLFYDISSKQSLKECVGRVKFSAETITRLFETLDQLILEMKDYLLDMESVVLDLEHVYTKEGRFYFCYCPWEKREVLNSFRNLLEEILGNLDYRDTEGVELAYHLYQSACKGDFHISSILEEHCSKQKEEEFKTELRSDPVLEWKENVEEPVTAHVEEMGAGGAKKSPGILGKILRFFLKKEKLEEMDAVYSLEEETHTELFYEPEPECGYTQVLEHTENATMLLGSVPLGTWMLRPLLPGYEEFCIKGESYLVGKKKDEVDGYINRTTISRIHSRLYVKKGHLFIADANSTNGTFVNDTAIEPGKEVEIFAGDRILFADVGYECYNSL